MNADRLLALYDRVADTPDAIARLRRLVLGLAVRGKLVEQDPADEPAAELLKRISAETARLTKAGKFQEPRSAVEINRHELPFGSPEHWGWVRLIEIARPSYGFAFKSSQFNSEKRGMPLIRIRDISKTDTEAYFEGDYASTHVVRAGDYLVGMDGDFNLRLWKGKEGLLNQRVMRINGWRCGVDPGFVRLPLQMVLDYLHGGTSLTTVKHLSAKQVNGIEIPLPPLAEQRRIVAKVNDLMALCDRLEEAQTAREDTRNRLSKGSLARLSAPHTDEATFHSHAGFAVDTLSALTARADHVAHLRHTIRNLAVRGKLVEQNPKDEPAAELLERIAAEKARLVNAGVIKARRLRSRARQDPLEFATPPGWELTDLGSIAVKITDGAHRTPTYVEEGVPFVSVKDFSTGRLDLSSTRFIPPSEHDVLYRRCDPRRGDILFGRIGTLGKAVLVDTDVPFSLFVSVGLIRFDHANTDPTFFQTVLNSPFVEAEFDRIKIGGGTHTNKLNLGDLHTVAFPLPPLAEQRRIVAKVNELTALCDRLEASLTAAEATRSNLLRAIIAETLASTDKTHQGLQCHS